ERDACAEERHERPDDEGAARMADEAAAEGCEHGATIPSGRGRSPRAGVVRAWVRSAVGSGHGPVRDRWDGCRGRSGAVAWGSSCGADATAFARRGCRAGAPARAGLAAPASRRAWGGLRT